MNLHEYQAKHLLKKYGLPVPQGVVVSHPDHLDEQIAVLDTRRWVVKAQIHAGGRGKAGGVVIADSKEAVQEAVNRLLGTHLRTYQTDEHGQLVSQVLIEMPSAIASELYLGAVVDSTHGKMVVIASTQGGVDIESVAQQDPSAIHHIVIDPLVGLMPFQCRCLSKALSLNADQGKQLANILKSLVTLFQSCDLSLLEINPLVITQSGQLLCLDAKISIDSNALYRQPELAVLNDTTQEDQRETRAKQWSLNYIALDGNIGCMVNGAGLAMATMDLIKLHGGNPANFLDVGGGATKERVAEAFKIIVSDSQVKGILVNIFGGIVRCDLIADGIIAAVEEVGMTLPVVVRLEGNNAALGLEKLSKANVNIIAEQDLTQAAQRMIQIVNEEQS